MKEREQRPAAQPANSGISAEADAALRARSDRFRYATQRKGMPMRYGHGDPLTKPEKKGGRR